MSSTLLERVAEAIVLHEDPVLYAEERMGAFPFGWQRGLLADQSQYIGIVCARQVGKTFSVGMKTGHFAATNPNGLGLIFAPSEQQSINLLDAARPYIKRAGVEIADDLMKEIRFVNGAVLRALPGSSIKTQRGWSGPGLLIVDEAAFSSNTLWEAVEPMVAGSGGQIIALSSADATFGWFYEAMTGDDPHWSRHKITAYEWLKEDLPEQIRKVTGYNRDWLEWKRKTIPDRVFRREYLAEFVDPIGTLIPEELRKAAAVRMDDPFDTATRPKPASMGDFNI